MLKGKYQRQYVNDKGNLVFVYELTGKKEALAQYHEIQGDFHRVDKDSGIPLYFSSKSLGNECTLVFTQNGKVVPDMSELNHVASLAEQFSNTPLGAEIARAAAQRIVAGISGKRNNSAPVQDADDAPDLIED